MTAEIDIKVADGIQLIRFMRPEKKNAFTGDMYDAMSAALDEGERSAPAVRSAPATTSTISFAVPPVAPMASPRHLWISSAACRPGRSP
jgi:hypothetical protein